MKPVLGGLDMASVNIYVVQVSKGTTYFLVSRIFTCT